LDKGAGNIDLYKENSLASKVEVGDYVAYEYVEKEYTTPEAGTGKEVNDDSVTYSSALSSTKDGVSAAKVNEWRVLSKKNGIVKLVADIPIASLTLRGANGWLNGPTVLNEMCETLYSGSMGTARSINVDDVNEITKYDGAKYYYNNDGETVTIPGNETKTIGDLEKNENLGLDKLEYRQTPDGRDITEYKANHYHYNPLENNLLTVDDKVYSVLFDDETVGYWLASTSKLVRFDRGFASFYMGTVTTAGVQGSVLYASKGFEPAPFCNVLPLVTLKSGLEVAGGTGEEKDPWTIKTVTEKSTVE